ncbi:MAG TPA: alpha/beta fold hydrolase [Candidatus Hydrogenedentes bacterium]|nr:alpha/beta fold hydrolase [Candidatus Hydrogenedentota bacterium]HIJ73977.1 alpha/beta fold hydrolase [Candidatus Hydrogenedentota bacterium]
MRRLKRAGTWFCAVALLGVIGAAGFKQWCDAHYYEGYDPALPLDVVEGSYAECDGYDRCAFTFQGLPGDMVPALLARPASGAKPFPCVVFLHGIGQSKEFLDAIAKPFTLAGFAVATFDQYTRGERGRPSERPWAATLALRERAARTVIETRRLIDCLETRQDVDPERVYLCGASFGAITGANAAAFDNRIRAVVLTYGGGNVRLLLSSQAVAERAGRWTPLLTRLGAYVFAPADPLKHVDAIVPRPVYFQNGTEDSLIPRAAAEALQDAAGEPKTITWYDSDHVGIDPEHTERVLADAVEWLVAQDVLIQSERKTRT